MTDRLDRIERILEDVAERQREMAARQQYHDEAFERFDAEMKVIKDTQAITGENIRLLAEIAGHHNDRLTDLEGGAPA